MLKKYKHIAFDLDGTLVHTLPEYRYKVVPKVVKELGGKISSLKSVDRFWFESGRDKIIENEFEIDPKLFWLLFRKVDGAKQRAAHTKAYVDSESCLRKLKEMSKTVSIITGAPKWIAEMEIEKLNGAPHDLYFSITNSEFEEKPDPASFNYVLKQLNMNPEETLYIGNSNEDAYFAKNAKTDFVYLERKEHKFDLDEYAIKTIQTLDGIFE